VHVLANLGTNLAKGATTDKEPKRLMWAWPKSVAINNLRLAGRPPLGSLFTLTSHSI